MIVVYLYFPIPLGIWIVPCKTDPSHYIRRGLGVPWGVIFLPDHTINNALGGSILK